MRQIKFRAWDGSTKEMWYPERLSYNGSDTFFAFYNDKAKTIGWGLYDRKLENRLINGAYPECVLMQFTGLHDKNGKEIYEGDIIRMNKKQRAWHSVNYFVGFVDFDNSLQYVVTYKSDWIDLANPDYSIEVIGNIYENPELIA